MGAILERGSEDVEEISLIDLSPTDTVCNSPILLNDCIPQTDSSPTVTENTSTDSNNVHAEIIRVNSWYQKKGLHIAHLNIHYLYPKLDEIRHICSEHPELDVLCICETFLSEQFCDSELKIDNYDMYRRDRQSNGGGQVIYVKQSIHCVRRHDIESVDIETMILEIRLNKQKSFILGYVYRPPSANNDWFDCIDVLLDRISAEDKELILLGDFNFNLLLPDSSNKKWLDIVNTNNLTQLITSATRVNDKTETLIDHIYTNNPDNILESAVPILSVSDHYPVICTRKLLSNSDKGPVHKQITYRSHKHLNPNSFRTDVECQPWQLTEIYDDPNDALDCFLQMFCSVLNNHAPMRKKRVKRINQPSWYSTAIKEASQKRDYFHKMKDTPNFRLWRNRTKELIEEAKTSYYEKTINNNKSNPKQLWRNLNQLSGKSSNTHTNFICDETDNLITDPLETATTFNEFFVSVFQNYDASCAQVPNSQDNDQLINYVQAKFPENTEYSIPLITSTFIKDQIKNMDDTKSTGLDDISVKFVKLAADSISPVLSTIFNKSISTGIFPNALKKAKITPIHKKGSKHDKNNYRPISILPILSKIIEKHVCSTLKQFVDTYQVIQHRQSGFRKGHSCQTALTQIIDEWITAIDQGNIVCTVFLDLTKAFDLVNHNILLDKMKKYRCSDNAVTWFTSYLSNRTQQVGVSGKLSEPLEIVSGVPQGSVLGPLLFILYINDLPLCVNACTTDMFADDTTVSTSCSSPESLASKINEDLVNIASWCASNAMSINVEKTKAMILSTKHKLKSNKDKIPDIIVNDNVIQCTSHEKLLGVQIDDSLTWDHHIDTILKKCNSLLYLLSRIKKYLNIDNRKLYFNAYILPHLDFCSTLWGNSSQQSLNKLLLFQKRAARVILDIKDYYTPSEDMFRELNWMTIYDRIHYQKSILMYKCMNGICPEYLCSSFKHVSEMHQLNLRSVEMNMLYVPKPRTEIYRGCFAYSGAKIWNSLPNLVKNANSVNEFKHLYLRHVPVHTCTVD